MIQPQPIGMYILMAVVGKFFPQVSFPGQFQFRVGEEEDERVKGERSEVKGKKGNKDCLACRQQEKHSWD